MKIYKYPLQITYAQVVHLPEDHKVLSVQSQGDQIMLWAIVDEKAEANKKLKIIILGTGEHASTEDKHLGTVQINGFVWHVFGELL